MAIMPYMNNMVSKNEDASNYMVKKISNYYKCDMNMYNLSDESLKTIFVDYVEKIIRRSIEYKEMISYLRNNIKMTYCSYFKKVDSNNFNNITIEIHHSPFTLYDITYAVLDKFIEEEKSISPFVIAEEVMLLHFRGLVGLIPLSKTVHELVHAGQIFIPVTKVFGDINTFFLEYTDNIEPKQKEAFYKAIALSEKLDRAKPKSLSKKFVYLDVPNMGIPHKIKEE